MIRRYIAALRLALMTFEALAAAGVFVVVTMVRYATADWQSPWRAAGVDPWLAASAFALTWVVALWLTDLYRLRARLTFRRVLTDTVRAGLLVGVAAFSALFVVKTQDVSRVLLLVLIGTQVVLTLAIRSGLRALSSWARTRGYNMRFVLVVGDGPQAQSFADLLERHGELGLKVIGHLVTSGSGAAGRSAASETAPSDWRLSRPILGHADGIAEILHERVVDEVAICVNDSAEMVEPITHLCQEEGRIVRIPIDIGLVVPGGRIEELDGVRIESLVYGPERSIALLGKRLLDLVIGSVALVVLSPVLLGAAIWLLIAEGRPVLFSQERVGLHGRPFRIFKFRTMVRDAEERYADVVALSDTKGAAFKMRDDPRVTRLGRILRRLSIDELPQLWNVVRGEMSLVGPRPAPPREVLGYDVWHRRRLSMKPGITGLWQVESRFDEEFDHRATLDLDYIDRWSLWLDFKIMLRTLPAMLQGR
ncbi:MAG: hypothetical protein QOF11_1717 [Chloroflexota bacterium]|jgi:exopolysaccharide biosynthesis polyprenyl glycosylphosphotransferase|nr:hypothetical protein [Chloroflexota bacterium]